MRTLVRGSGLGAAAVCLLIAAAFATAGPAKAWTPAGLQLVTLENHRLWNYDFELASFSTDGCDWPVTIVFWGNASVAKVKQALSSRLPIAGNEMYLCVTPDERRKRGTLAWSADRGVKTLSFTRALHVRLYADTDGRLTGSALGSFVLATTHLDMNEFSANPTYGYSEQAAAEIEAICAGVWGADAVTPDSLLLFNAEVERVETKPNTKGGSDAHVWQCDGLVTLVRVP